jgi:hypothetical protein
MRSRVVGEECNTGTPWSSWEDQDIRWGLDHNSSTEEIADFLCRASSEVRQRIREIAEADAIGDPSLLSDGLTGSDRTALETYRDARTAMVLIREAVEDCAPRGLFDAGVHRSSRGAGPWHLCDSRPVPAETPIG